MRTQAMHRSSHSASCSPAAVPGACPASHESGAHGSASWTSSIFADMETDPPTRMADQFDAIIYLGPVSAITLPPCHPSCAQISRTQRCALHAWRFNHPTTISPTSARSARRTVIRWNSERPRQLRTARRIAPNSVGGNSPSARTRGVWASSDSDPRQARTLPGR